MALRTQTQLNQDFPVATSAEILQTIIKVEQLVRDGFLEGAELRQIIDQQIGPAVGTFAEHYAAPGVAYTGTAGTSTLVYAVVPTYPNTEPPPGSAANPGGEYLNFIAGKPPQGRPPSTDAMTTFAEADQRTTFYGTISPAATQTLVSLPLSANNYVTVTVPAASADFPDVLFDVVSLNPTGVTVAPGSGANIVSLVATKVAAGTSVQDKGLHIAPKYLMGPNTDYPNPEVGVDTTTEPHTLIYGPLVTTREGGI